MIGGGEGLRARGGNNDACNVMDCCLVFTFRQVFLAMVGGGEG